MLQVCVACSTAFAVDLEACPHCGGTDRVDQGSPEHTALTERADAISAGTVEATDAEVRAWAQANEIEVAAGGRVPKAVREQYDAAHKGEGDDDDA